MITVFRERTALYPAKIGVEGQHEVPASEAETAFRRYAGRFVAVLRTATANALGNCVAWIGGFSTFETAERALAEAMSELLKQYGQNLTGSDVSKLGRRSYGRFVPEWGGPERSFRRLSLMFHYGRIYTPLNAEQEADDLAAYEAYMAKRRAEAEAAEVAARSAAEREAAEKAEKEAKEAAERKAREAAERLSREEEEDQWAVSQLMWRAYDRHIRSCAKSQETHRARLYQLDHKLQWFGIHWKSVSNPSDAMALAHQPWFKQRCMRDKALRKLRWQLIEEAQAIFDSAEEASENVDYLLPRILRAVAALRIAANRREQSVEA